MNTNLPLLASIFVAATTLCAQAPKASNLSEWTANQDFMAGVLREVTTPRYGFFITNKGVLAGFHSADGKILVNTLGEFILQRVQTGADGRIEHSHAGWINDAATNASVSETQTDGQRTLVVGIEHPRVRITSRIVCRRDGLSISYEFEPIDFPSDQSLSLVFPVNVQADNLDLSQARDTSNPLNMYTPQGLGLHLEYGDNFKPYNRSGPSVVARVPAITFYPFSSTEALPAGTKIPLSLQLTLSAPRP